MKNRIYSYGVATFFFSMLFSFFQMMYLSSVSSHWNSAMSGNTMLYHILVSILVAVIMECWCYFLPYLIKHSGLCYLVILMLNPLVWYVPCYISVFLKLLTGYLSILMAYQLFMYQEANARLQDIQETMKDV